MRQIVGIDPGLSGGIAILSDNILIVCEIPITKNRSNKKVIDKDALGELFIHIIDADALIITEQQQAYPNQGGVSNFTTGMGYGILLGLSLFFGHMEVHPKTWHKEFGISGTGDECKAKSIAIAYKLFPDNTFIKPGCRVDSDGLAEAALIAEWGRRLGLNGDTESAAKAKVKLSLTSSAVTVQEKALGWTPQLEQDLVAYHIRT